MGLEKDSNRYAGKVVHMYLPQDWSMTKTDISKISNKYGRTDSNLMLHIFKLLKNNIDVNNIPKTLSLEVKSNHTPFDDFDEIDEDKGLKIDFDKDVLEDLDKLIQIMWDKMWGVSNKEEFVIKIVNHFIAVQKKNGTLM